MRIGFLAIILAIFLASCSGSERNSNESVDTIKETIVCERVTQDGWEEFERWEFAKIRRNRSYIYTDEVGIKDSDGRIFRRITRMPSIYCVIEEVPIIHEPSTSELPK